MFPNFFKIISIGLKILVALLIGYFLFMAISSSSNSQIGNVFTGVKNGFRDLYNLFISLIKGQTKDFLSL